MKSNTSIGRGVKGSKFWMQVVIEHKNLRDELNSKIGEPLVWISPLADDTEAFLEYELKDQYVREYMGITKNEANELFKFWPDRQPQWDGLALSVDKSTLYIVEAKAHLSELESKCAASNPASKQLIFESLSEVHSKYYPKGVFQAWTDEYYQLANRLTFLHKLNEKTFGNIKRVKLVLLNFVNDNSYIPTMESEWSEHYDTVFARMTGSAQPSNDVILVQFDVSNRGIMPNTMTGQPIIKNTQDI